MNLLNKRMILFVLLIGLFVFPGTALAAGEFTKPADRIVLGGNFTLKSGNTLNGSLLAFGGNIVLEEGSRVTNDVIVFGGVLEVNAKIEGNFVSFGGDVHLDENTSIAGDLVEVGGRLDLDENAVIRGEMFSSTALDTEDLDIDFHPMPPFIPAAMWRGPALFLSFLWFLFVSLMMAALGVVATLLFPAPLERVGEAAVKQPVVSWGIGLLTAIVLPFLLVFLGLTIILLPLTLVGLLGMVVAFFFGILAIGYEIGAKFAQQTNNRWVPAVSCGMGSFALTFIIFGLGEVIPCLGWLLGFMVIFPIGLGAVILTRLGTQPYPATMAVATTAVATNAVATTTVAATAVTTSTTPTAAAEQAAPPPVPPADHEPPPA